MPSGTIKIIKLGNIGSAAARFVLQTSNTVSDRRSSGACQDPGQPRLPEELRHLRRGQRAAADQHDADAQDRDDRAGRHSRRRDPQGPDAIGVASCPGPCWAGRGHRVRHRAGHRHRSTPGRRPVHDKILDGGSDPCAPSSAGRNGRSSPRPRTSKFGASYFLTPVRQDGTLQPGGRGQTFELAGQSFSIRSSAR